MMDSDRAGHPDLTFEAIEATISETSRGRWFLAEHARRARTADTELLLASLGRIERAVNLKSIEHVEMLPAPAPPPPVALPAPAAAFTPVEDRLRPRVADLLREVAAANRALFTMTESEDGSGRRDDVSRALEKGNVAVLDAAEDIQDAAFLLRDRGADRTLCDLLDSRASAIYGSCATLDDLTRRIADLTETLLAVESRLKDLAGPDTLAS